LKLGQLHLQPGAAGLQVGLQAHSGQLRHSLELQDWPLIWFSPLNPGLGKGILLLDLDVLETALDCGLLELDLKELWLLELASGLHTVPSDDYFGVHDALLLESMMP
jgi:hypothetical protein